MYTENLNSEFKFENVETPKKIVHDVESLFVETSKHNFRPEKPIQLQYEQVDPQNTILPVDTSVVNLLKNYNGDFVPSYSGTITDMSYKGLDEIRRMADANAKTMEELKSTYDLEKAASESLKM